LLLFASANRDEQVFENADVFDIKRPKGNRHLSFGTGTHSCIGVPLALLQVRIAMELLTQRLPGLRLVQGEEPSYAPNILARGPTRLMVEWNR
jgi:cytochrome P450